MYLSKKTCYPKQLKSTSFDKFKPRYVHFLWFYLIFVCLVILFTPKFRLNASEVARIPNQIIVKYKDPSFSPLAIATNAPLATVSSDESPSFKYTALYPGQVQVVIIEGENIHQLLEELKNDPNVEYVEPNYVKQVYGISFERSDLPDDSDFNKQWALKSSSSLSGADIDYLEALALSRPSTPNNPVIVGIIDSSFDASHPDLINQLWVNEQEIPGNGIDDDNNGYIDDIHGYDFVNQTANLIGSDDHGTHVAGICAAENNNQIGISGAFPNVKFIPLACSIGDLGLSSTATLQAKQYLIELKDRGYNIVVANASYGSNVYSQSEYNGIQNLANAGILLCTASGNDGWDLDLETDPNGSGLPNSGVDLNSNGNLEVSYPNSYNLPNIIGVASILSNIQLALSSNYGQTEVDLAAPGNFIFSTASLDYDREIQDIILSNGTTISNEWIEGSSNISGDTLSGQLIDCAFGDTNDFPAQVNGQIALIERGGNLFFYKKVINAMNAGAVATIIYNNVQENANGSRDWALSAVTNVPWIPSFSISQADGNSLLQALPLIATLRPYIDTVIPNSNPYEYLSGTSMASPFVTAAVAFAAHNFPNETMNERRARVLNNVVTLSSLSDKVVTGGVLNLRKIVDTDEDNLPDWWEMDHFNTLNYNKTQDNDNDGYSNQEEFLFKTNPLISSDAPYFKNRLSLNNLQITDSTLEFNFIANQGYQYTIESTDSFGNSWQNQATYNGDGNPMKATITNFKTEDRSQTFYRLKATEQ
jgi:hypothetical protein